MSELFTPFTSSPPTPSVSSTLSTSEKLRRINDAIEVIKEMPYGTILPHAMLSELLGEPLKQPGYYQMTSRLSKALKKQHRLFIDSKTGEGYKIVPPENAIDVVDKKCHQAIKRYDRASKDLDNIPLDKINSPVEFERTCRRAQDIRTTAALAKLGHQGSAIAIGNVPTNQNLRPVPPFIRQQN